MGITERKEKERLFRKNLILRAAEDIFAEKGFENSTMEDIAKAAEFTKKTVYSYFNSKEELYYEIMLEGFKALNAMLDEAINENESLKETEKIKKLGQTFIEFSRVCPAYFRAISDYQNREFDFCDNTDNELIKECYVAGQYSFELLNKCLADGIDRGEISDKVDVTTVSLILWANVLGIITLINKKQKYIREYYHIEIEQLIENGFEMLFSTIKK